MSREIDERVVSMEFDNHGFEKRVDSTITSIDRLKKSLDFSGQADSVNELTSRFSAMSTILDEATRVYTRKAIASIERTVKALSVDQVAAGWNKFAQKTMSIQTILAATEKHGETIDSVTEKIERLNWFSDETSASLTDMTDNIAKFTSQGIKLDKAVDAMTGIANWGYLSGQGIGAQSRAMYNISQAMGTGAMKLIDWKSIQNANMATEEFKQTVMDTAVELGTLYKKSDQYFVKKAKSNKAPKNVTTANFADTLTQEWFTNDVMIKTLEKYSETSTKLMNMSDKLSDVLGDTTSSQMDNIEAWKGMSDAELEQEGITKDLIPEFREYEELVGSLGWKAFRAAQQATTFKQALESVSDASSSKWASIFESIFGNEEQAIKLWTLLANDLYDVFVAPIDKLSEKFKEAFQGKHGWSLLGEQIEKAGLSPEYFEKKTEELLKQYGGIDLKSYIKEAGYSEDESLLNVLKDSTFEAGQLMHSVEKVWDLFYGQGEHGEKMDPAIKELLEILSDTNEEYSKSGGKTGWDYVYEIFKSLGSIAKSIVDAIGIIFNRLFGVESEDIYNFTANLSSKLSDLSHTVGDLVGNKNFVSFLETVGELLRLIATVYLAKIQIVFALLKEVIGGIFDTTTENNFDNFADSIRTITDGINNFVKKVQDFFKNSGIGKFIGGFLKVIGGAIAGIYNFLKYLWELPAVQDVVAKISKWFEKAWENIGDFFTDVSGHIASFIEECKNLEPKEIFSKIGDFFKKFFDKLVDYIKSGFEKVKGKVGEGVSGIGSFIGGLFEEVKKFIGNVNLADIGNFILLLLGLKTVKGGIDLAEKGIGKLSDIINALISIPQHLNKFMDAFASVAKAAKFKLYAEAIKDILLGLAIVIGVVVLLMKIEKPEHVLYAIGALTLLIGAIALLMYAIGYAIGKSDGNLNPSEMSKFILAFVAVLAAIGVLFFGIGYATKAVAKTGNPLVTFLLIIVIMGAIAALLFVVTKAASTIRKNDAKDEVETISNFVLSLALIMLAIGITAKILDSVSLTTLAAMAVILVAIGLLLVKLMATNKMSITASSSIDNIKSVIKSIALLFISIAAMAFVLNIVSDRALGKGLAIILFVGAMIAAILWFSKNNTYSYNIDKFGNMILAMSAVFISIAAMMFVLNLVSDKAFWKGFGIILLVGAITVAMLWVTKNSTTSDIGKFGAVVSAMAAVILSIGVSLLLMSLIRTDKLGVVLGVLISIIVIFGLFLSFVKMDIQGTEHAAKIITSLAVAIAIIAGAIFVLSMAASNPERFALAGAILGGIMLTLAVLVKSCSTLLNTTDKGAIWKVIAMFGMITLLLVAIAGILYLFDQFIVDAPKVATLAAALSAIILALGGVFAILAKIQIPSLPAFMKAVGAFAILTGVITLIIGAITAIAGGIGQIEGIEGFLDGAIMVMSKVGEMFGSLISGFGVGLAKGVPEIVGFMTDAAQKLSEMPAIGEGTVDSIKKLLEIIGLITVAEILQAFASLFGLNSMLYGLPETLKLIGEGIVAFNTAIQNGNIEDIDKLKKATQAAMILTEALGKMPFEGGIFEMFIGKHNFESFADNVGKFAEGIVKFNDNTDGIDTEKTKAAATAGGLIAEMIAKLPLTGGELQKNWGQHDFGLFAINLGVFGTGLKNFNDKTAGIKNFTKLESAADAGKKVAEMVRALPLTGGYWQAFVGEKDFGQFSTNIEEFGKGLAAFSAEVKDNGIDWENVKKATDAGMALATMADKVPITKGLFKKSDTLDVFGEQIIKFASYLANFASISDKFFRWKSPNVARGADAQQQLYDNAVRMIDIGTRLAVLANRIPDMETTTDGNIGASTIIKKNYEEFVDFVSMFGGVVSSLLGIFDSEITPDNIENVEDGLGIMESLVQNPLFKMDQDSLNTLFGYLGDSSINYDWETIKRNFENLFGAFANLSESLPDIFSARKLGTLQYEAVFTAAERCIEVIKKFSEVNGVMAENNFIFKFEKMIDILRDVSVDGIIEALRDEQKIVEAATAYSDFFESVASNTFAIEALKASGYNLGLNLIEGIKLSFLGEEGKTVFDMLSTKLLSGDNLSDLTSLKNLLGDIVAYVSSDSVWEPTIKPIWDDSNLPEGWNTFGSSTMYVKAKGAATTQGNVINNTDNSKYYFNYTQNVTSEPVDRLALYRYTESMLKRNYVMTAKSNRGASPILRNSGFNRA